MTVAATLSKYVAAWITQKSFRFSVDERRLLFGLTNSQAASTLAAVLVGYNVILGHDINGEPIRLLNDAVLNGTILMILITCTIASFVTQKGAQNIALSEIEPVTGDEQQSNIEERILIPLRNVANVDELVNLSITIKSHKEPVKLVALNIITDGSINGKAEKAAKKVMERAVIAAAATDNRLESLLRYDLNVINGISNVVKEHRITDLVVGLHEKKGISDSFFGMLTESLLARCNTTTYIYKAHQPLATIKRYVIIVPENAEKEIGFLFWLKHIWNIGINTGAKLVFYASENTTIFLKHIQQQKPLGAEFFNFSGQDDFQLIGENIKKNDNLIIVLSRRSHISYKDYMERMPHYLNKYFQQNSYIMVYPMQDGRYISSDYTEENLSMMEPFIENVEYLEAFRKKVTKIFRK